MGCVWGIYKANETAIMLQVWMLFVTALFMILFSAFTGYYYGFFALMIPMLLSCHFYDVYIVCVYCHQGINTRRIPKMKAIVNEQPQVVYVAADDNRPIVYVNQYGQVVNEPKIQVKAE